MDVKSLLLLPLLHVLRLLWLGKHPRWPLLEFLCRLCGKVLANEALRQAKNIL
jgi:hypothetical protein